MNLHKETQILTTTNEKLGVSHGSKLFDTRTTFPQTLAKLKHFENWRSQEIWQTTIYLAG